RSGKTHYIRRRIKSLISDGVTSHSHIVTQTINEDWNVETLLQLVPAVEQGVVVLYFNVSAYADLERLERFFYNFFLFGLVYDSRYWRVQQFGNGVTWHVFVELSSAPAKDILFAHVSSDQRVLRSLPSLYFTGSVTWEPEPFEVDDDARLASGFLNAWVD